MSATRRANDGHFYSWHEFLEWYGDDLAPLKWNQAENVTDEKARVAQQAVAPSSSMPMSLGLGPQDPAAGVEGWPTPPPQPMQTSLSRECIRCSNELMQWC